MPGESTDMHLIDDGLGERPPERRIAFPIICARVGDHIPERRGHVVTWATGSLAAATRWPSYAFPVGIEQHLVRIKAKPPYGVERSGNTIRIDLTDCDPRDESVPIVVRAIAPRVEIDNPRRLRAINVVKQQYLRARTAFGEHAEIGAPGDQRRSQRETLALALDKASRHDVWWSQAILAEHWFCSPAQCCVAPCSGIDAG